jgi:hypothetical protein
MNRIVLGAVTALLLAAAGLFWWQGRATTEPVPPPPGAIAALPSDEPLPYADADGLRGPSPPEADPLTREQRRFNRLDRDRDARITRNEMLAPRAAAFRKLDVDGNNLLTFEEWAVRTTARFRDADANRDTWLSRAEFATTRPKPAARPECRCTPMPRQGQARAAPPPASDPEEGEPEL